MHVPQSKGKVAVFQVWYENQRKWMKGAPIPHLDEKSTGAEALLLSKPTVSISPTRSRGEVLGEPSGTSRRQQIPENRE